jgi:hypothetical protein
MRILTLQESLEEKRAKLQQLCGAPVFVAHGDGSSLSSFLYGEEAEVMLAFPVKPISPCFDQEGKRDRVREKELFFERMEETHAWFRAVGLHASGNDQYFSVEGKEVPPFLQDMVFLNRQVPTLRFCCSEYLANPKKAARSEQWTLHSKVLQDKSKTGEVYSSFQQLLPPGVLPERIPLDATWNRYLIVDANPGQCPVCAGASGERKHLGFITWSNGPMPSGMICRACSKDFFKSVQDFLDS